MERNRILRHHLATLAHRTQKAVRGAQPDFGGFVAGGGVRTPHELMNHVSNLMWFTAQALRGERAETLDESAGFKEEVDRFHDLLDEISSLLTEVSLERDEMSERLLQGPLSDAMTHVGQLALLRRLAGAPIPAEDFFGAPISRENLTANRP